LLRLGETLVEIGVALREVRLVVWRELTQLVADRLRYLPAVVRIEPVVRVAAGMNVAHRAGDLPGRNLENLDVLRCIQVSAGARLNLGVPAARDERRKPSDLELSTDSDQEVGAAHLEN